MPATIKDIAKKVGVNPSTVSRVINGTASISCVTASIAETLRIKKAFENASLLPASITSPIVKVLPF